MGEGTATTQTTANKFTLKTDFTAGGQKPDDMKNRRRDFVVSVMEGFHRHVPEAEDEALLSLMDRLVQFMRIPQDECEAMWNAHVRETGIELKLTQHSEDEAEPTPGHGATEGEAATEQVRYIPPAPHVQDVTNQST